MRQDADAAAATAAEDAEQLRLESRQAAADHRVQVRPLQTLIPPAAHCTGFMSMCSVPMVIVCPGCHSILLHKASRLVDAAHLTALGQVVQHCG